jgi:hypothetical protein
MGEEPSNSDNRAGIVHRVPKLLLIASFTLIILSLVAITTSPFDGTYEFSIYSALPEFFVLLTFSIIVSFIVLITQFNAKSNKIIGLAFFSLVLSGIILSLLPMLRGYYSYGRGDVLTHIGWMNTIQELRSFRNLHYPLNHILGVSFADITGIGLFDTSMIIPAFFSLTLILSIYALAIEILPSRKQRIIAIAIGSMLILGGNHISFAPFQQSVFLLPIAFFSLSKVIKNECSSRFKLIFIVFLIVLTLYHPLSSILLIIVLLMIVILRKFDTMMRSDGASTTPAGISKFLLGAISIASITYLSWQAYLILLKRQVNSIIDSILHDDGSSQLANYVNIITTNDLSFTNFIVHLFSVYGTYIILFAIAIFGLLLLLVGWLRHKQSISPTIRIFGAIFLLFLGIAAFELVFSLVLGMNRYLAYSALVAIFLIPLIYYDKGIKSLMATLKKFERPLILVFLTSILIVSMANLYASPFVRLSNYQVTESEMAGMDHLFQNCDSSVEIFELGLSQFRFFDALYGNHVKHIGTSWGYPIPPDHFGYGSETSWTGNKTQSKYMIINEVGRYSYPNIYPDFPERWRFIESDFERLNADMNITKTYFNGNLEIYYIP